MTRWMRRFGGLSLLGALFLGARCPPPEPIEPEPPRPEDAGLDANDANEVDAADAADAGDERTCQRACDAIFRHGCKWPKDVPCVDTCENQQASGIGSFCPAEIAAIKSCAELERIYQECE